MTPPLDGHPSISQQVDQQNLTEIHETLETMDTWFPTRIESVFNKAREVKDVITLLTNRKLHPDDMTTLMILSERMKMMPSALIFIIVDYENKKAKRNHV